MSRRWVVNASPLILLGKIGRAFLLGELAEQLIVPEAVAAEVAAKREGERALAQVVAMPGTQIHPNIEVPSLIETWDLGPGESQVLALAGLESGSRAVLDDLEGRRCAASLGLPVIGSLGVVLRAKHRGVLKSGRPVVEELRSAGLYVSDELIEQVLARLGE